MFPAEVIRDKYASRGRGSVYVPTHATKRVDLGVVTPYPSDDRAEVHPDKGVPQAQPKVQNASPVQPPASPPPPEQPGVGVDEEQPGVPLVKPLL
eukprot:10738623-Prorocentrum_lima.AAC.1